MRIIELDIAGSTNAEARQLADAADFGPLWIRANQQTVGRGRRGRNWTSPLGNLYASTLFPTNKSMSDLGHYSFVAAIAVHETLNQIFPSGNFAIKWPNDILLDKAKISGLLLETGKTHHQSWVVVGIGINIVSHPADTPYPATSLAEHQEDVPSVQDVMALLTDRFSNWHARYENQGFEAIRSAWLSRAADFMGPVTVRLADETFSGQAIDMDEKGALQVRLANGTIRAVHAGDVFLG